MWSNILLSIYDFYRVVVESYGDAVLSAARETGLDEKSFPSEMPWALADALRDDFILD
ncbi:DUF29 family protein [Salmonella enterica]|uniref:DUF29 family protein n=1 Tax=Salmonella enterica TaxID=28901 RepID=UPI0009A97AF3|nr:DUF29 family protein [Salmonella enterica]